jgi:hypothetical protein
MILLCGGEGAAGVKTGGAFFLLVSYAGPDGTGGHRTIEAATRLPTPRRLSTAAPARLRLVGREP